MLPDLRLPSWAEWFPLIYLGPAGVPLSCKGRTLNDGVKFVHELGLNALEVQFSRGIRIEEEYALQVGETAKELGVKLSVHSPYYTNLGSNNDDVILRSVNKIVESGHMADIMGADLVVAHPGFYTDLSPKETRERILENATMCRDFFRDSNYNVRLGLEVMGKEQTYGTLEEILDLVKEIGEGVVPVIDFAHIHARGNGSLRKREDFEAVLDEIAPLKVPHLYTYFTGVKYANGNELSHIPIKKGDLDFDLLGEVILERGMDITVISVSPIVEHDAVHMKIKLERLLEKMARAGTFAPVASEA